MPGQKRKYNVRFPPGRIKKIMQKDTEVGRMATAVPVIISLEMFMISFLSKTSLITQSANSRVMSINHMKQCIMSEKLFDFLRELAEQASGTSTPKEGKSKGKGSGHRKTWHSIPIKAKTSGKEETPKRPIQPDVNSDSSSESELVICVETESPS